MPETEVEQEKSWRSGWRRMALAIAVASAFGLGVYFLLEAVRPDSGLVSFSFLLVLPAAICAFVAYVADPWGTRPLRMYLLIPVWILLAVIVISLIVLREGVICVIILSPLWLLSGIAGTAATYSIRKRIRDGSTYCMAVLAIPLLAIMLEPQFELPESEVSVSRSAIVAAPPERIWPLLKGIPDVRPDEGAWNFSQDLVGVPRPLGAHLVGEGIGATRRANWGKDVTFGEVISDWQPDRRIGWRFDFDDIDGWRFTDRHLMPRSPYFRVTRGGYTMTPLADGTTRVTLETHYWIKTPVNAYSRMWGEVFLGDLETNLIALVKGRAERAD